LSLPGGGCFQNKKVILENNQANMPLKRICKRFVITGTVLIWTIKWIIRPSGVEQEPFRYFLNIAPNLFGSFLIPFAAYWFFCGRNYLVARVFRISSGFELRMVCLLGFCMLVVNEYLQRIPFFGRTFDYHDIAFSSVGLVLACMVMDGLLARKAEFNIEISS
jgi:hypothetical protein